ncbi:hypothetical protein Hanom_Chr11g01009891 [Helianthus anomalus]
MNRTEKGRNSPTKAFNCRAIRGWVWKRRGCFNSSLKSVSIDQFTSKHDDFIDC